MTGQAIEELERANCERETRIERHRWEGKWLITTTLLLFFLSKCLSHWPNHIFLAEKRDLTGSAGIRMASAMGLDSKKRQKKRSKF